MGGTGMGILLRLVVGGLCLAAVLAGSTSSLAGGASATGAIPGQYIVVLKPGSDRAAMVANARSLGGDVFLQYGYALSGFAVRLPDAALPALERNPSVLFVAADREVEAAAKPKPCVDLTQCQVISNGVLRIDGDLSSTPSGDGRGSVPINVAVLDTGIEATHPDLSVVGGVNCKGPGTSFTDRNGHGTMVAGFVGALDNDFGRVGVAAGARLWAVRVLDDGGHGTTSTIICGVDWVTSTRTDGDATNDSAVANMSLADNGSDDGNCGLSRNDPLHLAICNSSAVGVTYVVGAANDDKDIQRVVPAAYDEVLTVSAMADYDGQPGALAPTPSGCSGLGSDDTPATFSNFATLASDRAHTLSAPGVCIGSTYLNGGYAISSGTSFASPLVAGTVALCISSGPCAGLTPPQIVQKIVADAASYNTARKNSGYGFQGDPLRPISGKYYGYLIRAGLY